MFKKISVILSVLLLIVIPFSSVSADSNSLEYKEQILEDLGVLPDTTMYKGNFVKALGGFLFDSEEQYTAESVAYQTGITEKGESFAAKEAITVNEAVKYAVTVLGYKNVINDNNTYENVAAQLGLKDGITVSGDTRLNYKTAVQIIYNMLDAEPMQYSMESGGGYEVRRGGTLLEMNRGIVKIYGEVTANAYTSVYNEIGTGDTDYVRVDETEYLSGNTDAEELLGMNIHAFVRENKYGEFEIVSITERVKKNNSLEIDADDVDVVSDDFSVIGYYDGNKYVEAKISEAPVVIYNGISYGEYTADDFKPETGNLLLIDNDGDRKYDIIKITAYETVIVSSVDTDKGLIVNKYSYDGCLDTVDLKTESDGTDYKIYDSNGKETDISSVKINDILSVMHSKSGDKPRIRIYISDMSTVTGVAERFNVETAEIIIGGNEYKVSRAFMSSLGREIPKLDIGKEYIFYYDYFGKISYMKRVMSKDYKLFYKMTENDDETYNIIYMDLESQWHTAMTASKINYDGTTFSASEVYKKLKGTAPQIVLLKENANGLINSVDTAETVSEPDENNFTKTEQMNLVFRNSPKSLGMKYYFNDDAVVVMIPEDVTDRDAYTVRPAIGTFATDKPYTFTAYDCNRFNFTSIVTVVQDAEAMQNAVLKDFFVVKEVLEQAFDGEVLPVIKGNLGEYINVTLAGNKADMFNGIESGDVVNIGLDSNGRVSAMTKVFSMSEFRNIDMNEYYVSAGVVAGVVEEIDVEFGAIRLNCGKSNSFRISPSICVILCNPSEMEIESKTASSLKIGDKVLCRMTWGSINEIVCLEE